MKVSEEVTLQQKKINTAFIQGAHKDNYHMMDNSFINDCFGDLPQKRHNSHEGRSKSGSAQNRSKQSLTLSLRKCSG